FFFSSRRRHTRFSRDWSSDVCSSDLCAHPGDLGDRLHRHGRLTVRTPLSKVRGLGSARSGTDHFWFLRLTAIANVPLAVFFLAKIGRATCRDTVYIREATLPRY